MNEQRSVLLALVLTGLLSAAGCSSGLESPEAARPNIILILADDLGYGDLGCYGQRLIETPSIDSLARSGMRFTQHYAGSPVCAPSRCVLLTGMHTGHAYIRGNDEWGERGDVWDFAKAVEDPSLEGQRPLPPSTTTIARLLQGAGYRTAIVGKWGLGGPLTDGVPGKQGFDFFFGYNCQRQAHTYFPRHLWRNGEKVWLDNELVVPNTKLDEGQDPRDPRSYQKYALSEYAPDLLLAEALEFMESSRNQPFFLYFATPIPHVPLQAPTRWVEKYVEKFGDEAPYLGENGYFPQRYPRAAYAAMVSYFDDQVGQLIRKLDDLAIRDRTLILFSSDNGPTFNGGTDSAFFDSARPFRSDRGRGKGSLYEGGIRVPFIASWPGRIAAGAESSLVSYFPDILPTLCEIAGLPSPDVDGVSLMPTLLGRGEQGEHRYLYWEYPSSGGQQAIRMGQWKGLRREIFAGNLAVELFDLDADPLESNNLAAEHPQLVDELVAVMKREHVPAEVQTFKLPQLGD